MNMMIIISLSIAASSQKCHRSIPDLPIVHTKTNLGLISWGGHWWSGDGGGDDCDVGGLQPSTWFEDIDSWCSLRWNLVLVKLRLSSHLVHLAHCLKAQALCVKHSNSKPRKSNIFLFHPSPFTSLHVSYFYNAFFWSRLLSRIPWVTPWLKEIPWVTSAAFKGNTKR